MMVIDGRMLAVLGGVGAVSAVAFAIYVTRRVDDDGGFDPSLKPAADGKSIAIGGKTYGLHTVKLTMGSAHWVLSLPVAVPHTFAIQRDEGLDHLLAHLGALKTVSSGDARYDEEFEIRSKEEGWARGYFGDPEHRRLVQALFGLDASTVILSGGRLQAYFDEQSALAEGGPALAELAETLKAA